MSKFDLNLKIKPQALWEEILKKDSVLPHHHLQKIIKFNSYLKPNYFNWGRNALYYLFKSLPYTTITFPAFTCPTLIEAAEKAGKKVVLTEINLDTFNLDIDKIPASTKCLVVVHTFGNPVDIRKIRRKSGFKIFIIEDCAHAIFSQIKGKYMGSQGDVVLFSLYKQIANLNGALLLSKTKLMTEQAEEGVLKYWWRLIIKTEGFHQWFLDLKRSKYLPKIEKQKLADFKPSHLVFYLFNKGLKELELEIRGRRRVSRWYQNQVDESEFFQAQQPEKNSLSSYYQFALRLDPSLAKDRDKIVLKLRKKGIIIDRLWYQAPIAQGKYQKFQKNCPQALLLTQTVVNLPIYSFYTSADTQLLFQKLNQAIADVA